MNNAAQLIIALGSNMGEREELLRAAAKKCREHGIHIAKTSHLYETEPIGRADLIFLNAAATATTMLSPEASMQALLTIETELGRQRHVHWGNRTIDLDIILWRTATNKTVTLNSTALTVPHPRLLERDFVLVPCAEVAPDWVHPGIKKTLSQLVREANFNLAKTKPFPTFE